MTVPTKKEHIRTLGFALPYNNIAYSVAKFLSGSLLLDTLLLDSSIDSSVQKTILR